MWVTAIIAAGGSGKRLGGDIPKQFQLLAGRPVLAHTIGAFDRLDIIGGIVVAVPAGYRQHTSEIVAGQGFKKVRVVTEGGTNRAASIYAALKALQSGNGHRETPGGEPGIVLIHDGVRPFVSETQIRAVAQAAKTHTAAISGTPLTDTLKEVSESAQVLSTPDRKRYWRVQTPQGFTYDVIMRAYAQGETDGILPQATDDSMLVERLGIPVRMVEGEPGNIKITTIEDMTLGEIFLKHTIPPST